MDLLSAAAKAALNQGAQNVFDTFKRPFTLYVNAQVANIVSNPAYSIFGQNDQMSTTTPVTPQASIVTGCILYGKDMQWDYIAPENRTNYDQNKIRNSLGIVRVKVDINGYALMANCNQMILDGFKFNLVSTPRPHGVFGDPSRWTFFFQIAD